MFTVGIDIDTRIYFTPNTIIIAGIQIFSWKCKLLLLVRPSCNIPRLFNLMIPHTQHTNAMTLGIAGFAHVLPNGLCVYHVRCMVDVEFTKAFPVYGYAY